MFAQLILLHIAFIRLYLSLLLGKLHSFNFTSDCAGDLQAVLVPNVAFWSQKKRRPKYCAGRPEGPKDCQGRREAFKARILPTKRLQSPFKCRLVPNVAFWGQKTTSLKACQKTAKGAGGTFKGRLVPNVAFQFSRFST